MALSSTDLDHIADDVYKDRIITGTLYCGNCGYNLHSLPYVHTCPECGNQYNARPLMMKGIFFPHETYFPASELAVVLLLAPIIFVFVWGGINPVEYDRLAFAATLAVIMTLFAVQGYRRFIRFCKFHTIARRIALEEGE